MFAGKRNGEKQLRALLCRTPEWRDAGAREIAAAAAEGHGMPELAKALRTHNVSALRKRHFLALCRDWSYQSDVWKRVATEPRPIKRRHAEVDWLVLAPTPFDAAVQHTLRDISPTVSTYTSFMVAERLAPLMTLDLRDNAGVAAVCGEMRVAYTRDLTMLRQASLALAASGEAGSPVWCLGSRIPLAAELALHRVLLFAQASAVQLERANDTCSGLVARLQRPLTAPEQFHVHTNTATCRLLHEFVARANANLAAARAHSGGCYLSVSICILEQLLTVASSTESICRQRLVQFMSRMPPGAKPAVDWTTPFWEHAITLGAMNSKPPSYAVLVGPS